jgi:hypothetical protein
VPLFGKSSDKPILAVDIDGVISLFGFEEQGQTPPGEFHLIDGMLHCISMPTAGMLNRLGETFELIWASGWEDRANDHLPNIIARRRPCWCRPSRAAVLKKGMWPRSSPGSPRDTPRVELRLTTGRLASGWRALYRSSSWPWC